MNRAPRPRRCANELCREIFTPHPLRPMQKACSPACAQKVAEALRMKDERKELRERKAKLKTRSDYIREAQAQINRYVRLRDQLANRPCVSCDRPPSWDGQWHASHFRSVGAASAVRFNLWNIHRACSICNHHLSGNIAGYRPRLIARIGQDKVVWLEQQNHLARYSIEYLARLKAVFLKKSNQIQKRIRQAQEAGL